MWWGFLGENWWSSRILGKIFVKLLNAERWTFLLEMVTLEDMLLDFRWGLYEMSWDCCCCWSWDFKFFPSFPPFLSLFPIPPPPPPKPDHELLLAPHTFNKYQDVNKDITVWTSSTNSAPPTKSFCFSWASWSCGLHSTYLETFGKY